MSKPSVKTGAPQSVLALRMFVPGAATSTLAAPKFEKPARLPASLTAATQMRFACGRLQGTNGVASLLLASFPAAATTTALCCAATSTPSDISWSDAPPAAEAEVDHAGALARRIRDSVADVGAGAAAVAVEHANGHDPCVRSYAGDSQPVVVFSGGRPGHVRAVEVEVIRVAGWSATRAVHEVGPAEVVDNAVGVVVDPVAGHLARIAPEVRDQVGVGEIDTGVHHRDHLARAPRGVPRAERVHPRVRRS